MTMNTRNTKKTGRFYGAAKAKYAVFYKTVIIRCGKVVEEREEPLGTTFAVSEKQAISNIYHRTKLPVMSGCDDDGKGYERHSIMRARKIEGTVR